MGRYLEALITNLCICFPFKSNVTNSVIEQLILNTKVDIFIYI